jgi:hypothetical protein
MRRFIIRIIIGVVLGVSWIIYQLSDFTSCSGPRAKSWFESSILFIDESISDFDFITPSITSARFSQLACNAKSRYENQQILILPVVSQEYKIKLLRNIIMNGMHISMLQKAISILQMNILKRLMIIVN